MKPTSYGTQFSANPPGTHPLDRLLSTDRKRSALDETPPQLTISVAEMLILVKDTAYKKKACANTRGSMNSNTSLRDAQALKVQQPASDRPTRSVGKYNSAAARRHPVAFPKKSVHMGYPPLGRAQNWFQVCGQSLPLEGKQFGRDRRRMEKPHRFRGGQSLEDGSLSR